MILLFWDLMVGLKYDESFLIAAVERNFWNIFVKMLKILSALDQLILVKEHNFTFSW